VGTALQNTIAVVTGASRGIGKGIGLELGTAGATVYVTGRAARAGTLPGTVEETAAEITSLGGHGVPVVLDHRDDDAVRALFDRIGAEHGHLDILVNNVYSSPDLAPWLGRTFWELPLEAWDQTIDIGVRSHYVASVLAAPLLIGSPAALIVNVSSSGAVQYAHNVVYGVGKAALDRMTVDMARELRPHGVAVVSIWPGLVKTELVLSGARQDPDRGLVLDLPGEGILDLSAAETPQFSGRAVVALATDAGLMSRTGTAAAVADLATEYGFCDIDGRMPTTRVRS
jgi:dehydrogenase/reductase SDR family protein 1